MSLGASSLGFEPKSFHLAVVLYVGLEYRENRNHIGIHSVIQTEIVVSYFVKSCWVNNHNKTTFNIFRQDLHNKNAKLCKMQKCRLFKVLKCLQFITVITIFVDQKKNMV